MRARRLLLSIPVLIVTAAQIAAAQCPDPGWGTILFPPWSREFYPPSNVVPETWVIGTSDPQGFDDVVWVYLDEQLVGVHESKTGVQTMFHEVPGCVAPGQHKLEFVLIETHDIFKTWCFKLERAPCSQVIQVAIDVKPGADPNKINLGSRGVIPVAILSDSDFDATMVLPMSVELEGASVAVRNSTPLAHSEDVDGDGDVDLLVKIEASEFDPGPDFDEGYVTLTGLVDDGASGTPIEGEDYVIVVP